MSLQEKLVNHIQNIVSEYINLIANRYEGIDVDDLASLWNDMSRTNNLGSKTNDLSDVNTTDLSPERLTRSNKTELSALCKAKGLKVTGKKEDLIQRLLGNETESKKQVKTESKKQVNKLPSLLQNISKEVAKTAIAIRRNVHGNFEHLDTGLVFDSEQQKTICGKQQPDGTISSLTDEDIENCKKYKFKYTVPKNLDKDTLDNVKITELDEESDIVKEDEQSVEDDEEEEVEDDEEEEIEIED